MSKDEAISIALGSISELRKLLETADDLENTSKKNSKQKHLLKNSKQFIDDLYTISNKIKTNFYAEYDKLEKEVEDESEDGEILVDNSVQDIENSTVENSENEAKKDSSKAVNTTDTDVSTEENSTNVATSEPKISDSDEIDVKPTFSKSIIRVVDLNKLIDPKQKKSVKFDSSVIILTSSDEEESPIVPPNLKENGLKSSLKASSDKTLKTIEVVKDDEIKENSSPRDSRKSSRIRNVQSKKETHRTELKKIFKRQSDKNFEIISKRSKINSDNSKGSKKESSKATYISSSESDSDRSKSHERGKLNTKSKVLDKKFHRKVYVPLPLVQCEKLKEVYNTNKDIFACTSGTRSSKRMRRTSGYESDNESSKNKKTKTVEDKIAEEHKSDDESSVKDNVEQLDVDMPNDPEKHKKKKHQNGSGTDASETEKDDKEGDKDEDDKTDKDEKTIKRNKQKTDKTPNSEEENKKEGDPKETVDENDHSEVGEGKNIDEDQNSDKESSAKKEDAKGKKTDDACASIDEDQVVKENSEEKTDKTDDEGDKSDEDSSGKKQESRKTRNKSKPGNKKQESDEENSKKEAQSRTKKNKSKNTDASDKSDVEGSDSDKKRESDEDNSTKNAESKKKKNKSNSSDENDSESSKKKRNARKNRNKTKSSENISDSDEENSSKKVDNKKKKNKSNSSDENDSESSEKKRNARKNRNKTKSSENISDSDEENSSKKVDNKKKKNKSKSSDESEEESSGKERKGRKRDSDVDDDHDSTKNGKESKASDDESVGHNETPGTNKEDEETDIDAKTKKSSKASDSDEEDKVKDKKKKKKSESRKNDSDESDGVQKDKDIKKEKKDNCDSEGDNSDEPFITNFSKMKKNKITIVLSDSDDDDDKGARGSDEDKDSDDSDRKKTKKKTKKKIKKAVVSDSDYEDKENKKSSGEENSDSSNSDEDKNSDSDDEETPKKKANRKSRIKKSKNSSSDSEEEVSTRKKIRHVLDKNSLSESTLKAEEEEKERKARIAEKQKKYNRIFEEKKDATVESVVLDYEDKTKEPRISVHKKIVKHLKPHQVSGIQFMYDACFESVERTLKSTGSGCILAHCMGLGKTLQVVALTHTLLTHSKLTKVERVMVVCPINTVLNWKAEYKKWVPKKSEVEVYELATSKKNYERQHIIKEWFQDGGVLIIGYTMFRNISNPANKKITKKMRNDFHEGLVDPGPDLVICDEGHLLKNEKTHLSIAMNRIKTARRIVLTGTPLQNNLKEYWCMVQFIKPNLLGTYKEYMNRFVNPITNGQYTDSTQHDTILMRKRSHVLHKLLDGVVQRRDYAVLEPYLPTKHEYVLFVKLSDTQTKLYKYYIEKLAKKNDGSSRTSFLFNDFQQLQRICTHPRVLADKTKEQKEKWNDEDEESEGSLKDFIDDGDDSSKSSSDSSSNSNESDVSSESTKKRKTKRARVTRAVAAQRKENNEEDSDIEMISEVRKEWWQEYCDGDELDNIKHSGKLSLFFEILKECEDIGDKILVFSQSLFTLNCIEYFLGRIDEATSNNETDKVGGYKGTWELGLDYFRLDGSSSCDNRAYWCDSFNNPDNDRARLFLISTRAGGLGINLVAANRVIIFDVSWNPSHDIQSIYRVYRFGQTKPCYIYRFVTYGAMEMKIYERQVTKQAISKRVIDEQQIDRHYNQTDLQELYQCDLDPADRPLPMVPKDVLLGEMLQKYDKIIYKYHLHQSLLENKHEECLNEEERKAAWEEFESEKVLRKTTLNATPYLMNSANMSAQAINAALTNIVKRDNPNWSEAQIKGIIPALVRQLQIQIEENDMSMYQRVVQEIQIMNQAKLKESYYQQQMMKYYQQQMLVQKRQQALLGNLNFNPTQIQNMYGMNANSYMNGLPNYAANGPSTSAQNRLSNDIIDLND